MEGRDMTNIKVTGKDGAVISATLCNFDNDNIKGAVIVCHGFGEHTGLFLGLAERLGEVGYACVLFDQRGHGKPPDGRKKWFGVIVDYQCFLDDVASVTDAVRPMLQDVPIALYGHSMGGNIVINALLKNDPTGYKCAILDAPWLQLYKKHSPLLVAFSKLAGRISPTITTVNKLKPEILTSDPEMAGQYVNDPLYHGQISFRMYNGINNGCAYALDNASRLTIPVFISYAAHDKVLCNDAILSFAAEAGDMVTIKEYDSRHAIRNDISRDEFYRDVIAYLDKTIVK